MTELKEETVKCYHLEANYSNYHHQNKKSNTKNSIFMLRTYFLNNNTIYVFLKIFLGFLLFGLPVYCFKQIINLNYTKGSDLNYSSTTNYSTAAVPLIISISIFVFYIVVLLILKSCNLCTNRYMFPPWDRNNIGFLISALFISLGILFFVMNLIECLTYLDMFRDKLIEDLHSSDVITSTTAKILLYNVFDQKVLNLNFTNLQGQIENFTNSSLNFYDVSNFTNFTRNYSTKSAELNGFDKQRREFVIFDILIKLYRPVLFICIFILVKVKFLFFILLKIIIFKTKNSIYYIMLIFTSTIEYFQIKMNLGKRNSSNNNIYEIVPIYLFFIFYISYILKNSFHFVKKYSENIHDIYESKYNRTEKYSFIDRFLILFLDSLICIGLFLFVYAFTFSIICEYHINFKGNSLYYIKYEDTHIKLVSLIGIICYIVGNFYKIGNLTLLLAFYSVEKELLPCKKKKFYVRVEKKPHKFLQNENNEIDLLLFSSSN